MAIAPLQSRFTGVGINCQRVELGVAGREFLERAAGSSTPCLREIIDAYTRVGDWRSPVIVNAFQSNGKFAQIGSFGRGDEAVAAAIRDYPALKSTQWVVVVDGSSTTPHNALQIVLSDASVRARAMAVEDETLPNFEVRVRRTLSGGAAFFVGYQLDLSTAVDPHTLAMLVQGAMPRGMYIIEAPVSDSSGLYCTGFMAQKQQILYWQQGGIRPG